MRKHLIVIAISLLAAGLSVPAGAQTEATTIAPMTKGNIFISAGFGPATNWSGNYRGFSPGLMTAVDVGFLEVGPGILTVGGEFGLDYNSFKHYKQVSEYTERNMSITLAARSTYHYGWDIEGLDTYGGIAMGPRIPVFHDGFEDSPVTGLGGGFFAGASYFFTPELGVNAEVGYNITYLQAGMVYILK